MNFEAMFYKLVYYLVQLATTDAEKIQKFMTIGDDDVVLVIQGVLS